MDKLKRYAWNNATDFDSFCGIERENVFELLDKNDLSRLKVCKNKIEFWRKILNREIKKLEKKFNLPPKFSGTGSVTQLHAYYKELNSR